MDRTTEEMCEKIGRERKEWRDKKREDQLLQLLKGTSDGPLPMIPVQAGTQEPAEYKYSTVERLIRCKRDNISDEDFNRLLDEREEEIKREDRISSDYECILKMQDEGREREDLEMWNRLMQVYRDGQIERKAQKELLCAIISITIVITLFVLLAKA